MRHWAGIHNAWEVMGPFGDDSALADVEIMGPEDTGTKERAIGSPDHLSPLGTVDCLGCGSCDMSHLISQC